MIKKSVIQSFVVGSAILFSFPLFASSNEPVVTEYADTSVARTEHATHEAKETKFNPGTFIFEHIGDSYSWHILSYKDFHLAIPLPVIVYSKHQGLVVFMASKFHHGHSAYHGFEIAKEGSNKGKVVEVLPNGKFEKPIDISITKNVLSIFISIALILYIFLTIARMYKKRAGMAPAGIQSFFEPIIIFVRDDIARPSIGEKKFERFMPFLLTVFFFIWINNMLGLIPIFPGGANVTGNISVTLVLALFTFLVTTFSGNKNYWLHIVNAPGVPWWLKLPIPLMPFIEFVGMLTKPFVLMVRLFANITAGHMIAMVFFSLIFIFGNLSSGAGYGVSVLSIVFTVFMSLLEFLVALIQAYVFTLLSSLYFGAAVEEHHHEAKHEPQQELIKQ
jgi:F-type H+-transporting ATPase subunit a